MIKFRKFICAILSAVLCFMLCSCSESADTTVYLELISPPATLDPQVASSDSDLIIVRNLFEGLLRKDKNGKIVDGACSDYKKDGLTYSFTLRKDIKWSNGKKLTADDFVFGFKRALDPKTAAPFASRLFAITNAKAVNRGEASPDTLGVSADGNKLYITLSYEDQYFEDTLTTSVAMPCNKKFFEKTEGQYGLTAEHLISNGSYRIGKWHEDEFGIRLYKNEKYNGDFKALNGAVFISAVTETKQLDRLNDNDTDIVFLPADEISAAEESKIQILSVQNICWLFTMNEKYNEDVRKALIMSLHSEKIATSMPKGFYPADSIYPEILHADASQGILPYDIETAKNIFSAQVAKMKDKKFPASTLYYYESPSVKDTVTDAVGHWQQNLSAFFNIQSSDNLAAFSKELDNRDLEFSIFPVKAQSANLDEYFGKFHITPGSTAEAAQEELLSKHTLYPFAFESTRIAYNSCLSNVVMFDDNGYIDFSFVEKKE